MTDRLTDDEIASIAHGIHECAGLPLDDIQIGMLDDLIAEVRRHRNTIARVQRLADAWTARGEHDMAYSKTMPDENIAAHLLGAGAEMVENGRHIRNALTEETDHA